MNIMNYMIELFFKEEAFNTVSMIVTSFIINILQTNGISLVTANIIDSLTKGTQAGTTMYYYYFVLISIIFLAFYYLYKIFQNRLLTKLRQWIRYQLIKMMLIVNNQKFSETNFTKLNSPINRISSMCFMVFNDVITFLLPNITFLLIIAVYFTYKSWKIGGAFVLGNLILLGYLYVNWDTMTDLNRHYESHISENEGSLIEILNNIDKIITRGQVNAEVTEYLGKTNEGIDKAFDFYSSTNNHGVVMNGIVYLIIFLLIGYLISGFFNKQVDLKTFITFFTILILYRDRMFSAIQQIPDFIEFMGRSDAVLKHFKDTADDYVGIMDSKWAPMNLGFDVIKFENVRFKYKSSENYVMDNASFALETDGKIIGVTGLSGRGKSTFAKLLIKLYKPESGKIYIDGVDIESVDTDYIRRNITYVNQTSKLFDKKILENIFYGCGDIAVCQERLREVLKYDKIRELFKNVDLENTRAGSLGEGLSGGQRQVVNIISGLVNDSKILILDEPTNALDGDLKKTVLEIIRRFKQYKKCIIVITHDKDMDAIFTDKMSL